MKGYNYSKNYNNALQYVNIVKTYIELNPHIKEYSRIKLAKNISKNFRKIIVTYTLSTFRF